MSKSYDRNIERLKANISQRSAEMQRINTEGAILRGKEGVERVRAVTEGLEPFSKELQEWKKWADEWVEELKFPFYLGGPIGEIIGGLLLKQIWKKNLENLKNIIEK